MFAALQRVMDSILSKFPRSYALKNDVQSNSSEIEHIAMVTNPEKDSKKYGSENKKVKLCENGKLMVESSYYKNKKV